MKNIEVAITAYHVKHGKLPFTLTDLVIPAKDDQDVYLDEETIVDPWGQIFRYDPKQVNDKGRPRISSAGEPGRNESISNW